MAELQQLSMKGISFSGIAGGKFIYLATRLACAPDCINGERRCGQD